MDVVRLHDIRFSLWMYIIIHPLYSGRSFFILFMPIAKVLTFSGIAMIKDSFLCFYNDFVADTSSPVHAAMLTEGASCKETSCSDPYINRNIARAALTAVWRYRLLLEAGRGVLICDSRSCCGEGRVMPVCDFHSCCGMGRRVPACDSLSVLNSRACGGRHGWIA